MSSNEVLSSETACLEHVENVAAKIFVYADNEDRAGRFGK